MARVPFTRPTPARRTRVASASRVGAKQRSHQQRTNTTWQEQALAYSHRIPEADYATTFFGGAMSKLEFPIQKRDPGSGEWVTVEDPNDVAVQAWNEVQDPGGGRTQIARQYGELGFTTGEGYLCQTWDEDDERTVWEYLSPAELRPTGDHTYTRQASLSGADKVELREPDEGAVVGPGQIVAFRMWRARRDRSMDAWSPMGAVADVCAELLDLTLAARAASQARIARAHILFLPPGLSDADDVGDVRGDDDAVSSNPVPPDDPQGSTMVSRLLDHITEPVTNPASHVNLTPYVVDGWDATEYGKPSDYLLKLYDPAEAYIEIAKREEVVRRFARGVNLPVEIVLGMGDANHWSGWLIDDQTWQAHVQPEALRMVTDLTRVYLWAALTARNVKQATAMDYRIWYEESGLVVNPDRSADAFKAHAGRAISDHALRREINFNDDDAPSEEFPNSFPVRGQGIDRGGDVPPEPTTSTTTDQVPPAGDGHQASGAPVDVHVWLDGAQAIAVERCHELAGSRLRAKIGRVDPDVPNVSLARHVGTQAVKAAGFTPLALVDGGSAALDRVLSRYGWSDEARRRVCAETEAYAADTLCDADGTDNSTA